MHETQSGGRPLFETLSNRAIESVVARLTAEGSELAKDDETLGDVRSQVALIVHLATQSESIAGVQDLLDDRNRVLGARRAQSEIHPSVSLKAATICFEEIFPLLLQDGGTVSREEAVRHAVRLQGVVGHIVLSAATGYVDHLLDRLRSVHLQERRAIAAYLHDNAAQTIASAIQRLQYEEIPIEQIGSLLREALAEVRSVALDLRQYVGEQRLDEAISDYLDELNAQGPTISFRQTGVPSIFSPVRQEESFFIARELVRNAIKHAAGTTIDVHLEWKPTVIRLEVIDNGRGYDFADTHVSRMGLLICRERAESISAVLDITTALGKGTIACLEVPR